MNDRPHPWTSTDQAEVDITTDQLFQSTLDEVDRRDVSFKSLIDLLLLSDKVQFTTAPY